MKNKKVKRVIRSAYKSKPEFRIRGYLGRGLRNADAYLSGCIGFIWAKVGIVSIKANEVHGGK